MELNTFITSFLNKHFLCEQFFLYIPSHLLSELAVPLTANLGIYKLIWWLYKTEKQYLLSCSTIQSKQNIFLFVITFRHYHTRKYMSNRLRRYVNICVSRINFHSVIMKYTYITYSIFVIWFCYFFYLAQISFHMLILRITIILAFLLLADFPFLFTLKLPKNISLFFAISIINVALFILNYTASSHL